MTDANIDNVIAKEKARTERATRKLMILTATDAGMAPELAELFIQAKGGKYEQATDGKLRHRRTQVPMIDHLQTTVKTKRPTYFGIADAKSDAAKVIDPARVELEALAFQLGNMTARGKLVKQIGEAAADARAKEWGLRDLMDKTKGVRPEVAAIEAKAKLPPAAPLNISQISQLFKTDPEKARAEALRIGVKI
jgi:hypothetical protein